MPSKVIRNVGAALVAIVLVGGCQSAQIAEPLTATTSGNDEDSQLEFYHTLAERNMASNDEAFHAVLLYIDGADPAEDYPGRLEVMKEQGLLPAGFDKPADHAVTVGTMAMVMARALEIKGGLTMRIFGPSPRYALNELLHLQMFPLGSSTNQAVSGSEVLSVIGKMEDYQKAAGTYREPEPPSTDEAAPPDEAAAQDTAETT